VGIALFLTRYACLSTKIKLNYVYIRGLKFAVKNLQAWACQASQLDVFNTLLMGMPKS
jgi:hypothetical protein